jgi:transcriptional regulator with XRE-family HTH domain
MELRDRLATLRKERGYSLRELRGRIERETGEKMAISYLSSLERVGGAPSIETLTHIAAGYGLSVNALLAPVDLTGELSEDRYPQSLLDFVRTRGLDEDWLDALSSVQYRGERPDTEEEWAAVYGVLNLLSQRRAKR